MMSSVCLSILFGSIVLEQKLVEASSLVGIFSLAHTTDSPIFRQKDHMGSLIFH